MFEAPHWTQVLKSAAEAVSMCVAGDRFLRFPLVFLMFRSVECQVRKAGNNKGAWKFQLQYEFSDQIICLFSFCQQSVVRKAVLLCYIC